MNFFLIFSLLLIGSRAQSDDPTNEVVEPNNDVIPDASKEAVIQHPVTVSIGNSQPMTTRPPMAPLKTRVVVVHNNMVPVPIECFQPPDSGTCSKDMARVYYDHETRTCKPFSYTGCSGNANRFQSIKNCYRICHPYRYKIRPKVARSQQSQAMKVRVIPSKQDFSSANDVSQQAAMARALLQGQAQAGQARALLQAQAGQARARSMSYPYQQRGYGGQYPQQGYPGGYGGQPSYGGQQGYPSYGRQMTPLTQRHVVMTPNGPQVKNQMVGQGSGMPDNTGQIQNYGGPGGSVKN